MNALCKQMLSSMLDMIIRERRHGVVAVVVIGLISDVQFFIDTSLLGCFDEVLGE